MISPYQAPPIIREYIVYIETIKGKSQKTADSYFRDLRNFFRFLKHFYELVPSDTPIDEIDISDIDIAFIRKITLADAYEYFVYCKNVRNNNEKTRARKTSAIKSYFKYLTTRAKYLDVNPLEELDSPKPKKSLPKYLTLEQSISLLKSIDGEYKERNYAIITMFLNCGLRLAELCSLDLNSLNFNDNYLVVTGKGNKQRTVYLNNACVLALQAYLNVRPVDGVIDKRALFISKRGKRISRRMVEQLVTDLLQKSGLAGLGFSTHKLRHTAATLMYQHGHVDTLALKEILEHESLATTQIYTHVSPEQLKAA
ncbi:MAG: tyrosine recombinase XerC, partial [Clostridia bacterium]|nr:tyrosine recombinase XerC [Clostridia bacterium]